MNASREIGERIRSRRLASGLTQEQLAQKLGVTTGLIGHWEHGRYRVPPPDRIQALERIIGNIRSGQKPGPDEQAYESTPILGKWLSDALSRKGWTVIELAEKSKVSQATIYNLQNGRAENPRRRTIESLEKALGETLPKASRKEIEEGSDIQGVGDFKDFNPYEPAKIPHEPGVYVLYDVSTTVL